MALSLMARLNIILKCTTVVGRVWLPVLFVIRVLTLLLVVNSLWKNEESSFSCNTQQPGCTTSCVNQENPITHPHYWFCQILLVTAPTWLWFFSFLTHPGLEVSTAVEENWLSNEKSPGNIASSMKSSKISSPSKKYYIMCLLFKLVLEICFLVGQRYSIGFLFSNHYVCEALACPMQVDCFYPNAWRKNTFITIMASLTGVSILLLLVELLLSIKKKTDN